MHTLEEIILHRAPTQQALQKNECLLLLLLVITLQHQGRSIGANQTWRGTIQILCQESKEDCMSGESMGDTNTRL